jgi:uncharacterized coiled-coil protein SlyX
MGTKRKLVLLLAAVSLLAGAASAQDSPSLGDLARQQRQQKTRSKTAQGTDKDKEAKASKVITDEELTRHAESSSAVVPSGQARAASTSASSDGAKQSSEEVKSQIQQQKSQIASLRAQIDQLDNSIHFAPPNCVENCVQWNERQKQKQQQVENMQTQLEELKKRLEEMQKSARKRGYGSSVYDP